MAEQKRDFTIPDPDKLGSSITVPSPPNVKFFDGGGTSAKGLAIGFGVLVVLMVVFIFLKGMYANSLVARKVAPPSANQAGWWLFVFLSALAAGAIFAIVDQSRFLSIIYLAPLGLVAAVSLVLMILASRR